MHNSDNYAYYRDTKQKKTKKMFCIDRNDNEIELFKL